MTNSSDSATVVGIAAAPVATTSTPQTWRPDVAVGGVLLFVGLFEVFATTSRYLPDITTDLFVVAGVSAAAGLSRRMPAVALALFWVTFARQAPLALTQTAAVAVVLFGTARWGRRATFWLSGLSIPLAVILDVFVIGVDTSGGTLLDALLSRLSQDRLSQGRPYQFGEAWGTAVGLIEVALLALPWLAGVAWRLMARARRAKAVAEQEVARLTAGARRSEALQAVAQQEAARAQRDYEQAAEIARLREDQARMARDVHDVVGHSLAVILAQAESAQFLPDDDPERLKATMATIATSARTSLQDVRQVLSGTRQEETATRPQGLDDLIEGARASGHEVVSHEVGTPQPLPPELEVVAYRVLQEMLTNAIRHGRRHQQVLVERHWPESGLDQDLRIEVRNVADSPDLTLPMPVGAATGGGHGLEGMRRRLESVGGRLDIRRRAEPDGATFTVTAWVPVRAGAR